MLDVSSSSSGQSEGGALRLATSQEPPTRRSLCSDQRSNGASRPLLVALAGLVLAFALLGPSAAVAKQGGTDRPIAAKESGTNVIDVATGAFVVDVTGTGPISGR